MENEIKAIIEKNLPAHVGDVLKKTLQKAENDARRVAELESQNGELCERVNRLNEIVNKYKDCDHRNSLLDAREKKIQEQERDMKIKELEYKLVSEQDKTEFCKSVANGLVRNIEYRSNVFSNKTEWRDDKYGNRMSETNSSDSSTTKNAG